MATIFVLTASVVSYLVPKLVFMYAFGNYEINGMGRDGISIFRLEAEGGGLIALLICVATIGILSFWMMSLDETHFGRNGATRWAITGGVFGLIQLGFSYILALYKGFYVVNITSNFIPFLVMAVSYGIVFKISWSEQIKCITGTTTSG